jgi:hypothetical protein
VAAIAVLWIGIGVAVLRTGFELLGDLPLSRLAADGRAESIFGPSLVVAALLFIVFCVNVTRRYPVGRAFAVVMIAAMGGQLVAGVVPIGAPGESDPVHVAAGLVLGGLIPVFLGLFAVAQPAGPWRTTSIRLFVAQLAATVVGVALSGSGRAALAEMLPALFFHVWVVAVTLHVPEGRLRRGPREAHVGGRR